MKKQAEVEEKEKIIAEMSLRVERERSVGERQVFSKKEAETELEKFTKLFAELEAKSIKKDIEFVERSINQLFLVLHILHKFMAINR